MIKGRPDNKYLDSLRGLQQNKEELARCTEDPVYFYNRYIRREGQPVLTEEDYKKYLIETQAQRERIRNVRLERQRGIEIYINGTPVKPKDATPRD